MADPEPVRDWIVTFAHMVAYERDYTARHPGAVFKVMLSRDEAEGLLAQVRELVDGACTCKGNELCSRLDCVNRVPA